MTTSTPKRRLDQILLELGLVNEGEIKDALVRQKTQGGKFGSQLLCHGYLNETSLVKALTLQYGCEGVILGDLEIPELLLRMVPKKVALTRKVVPFDYDTETNTLKIACEDPQDDDLLNELSFVARGNAVKCYVAAEIALNYAISKYYLNKKVRLSDCLILDIPEEDLGRSGEGNTGPSAKNNKNDRPEIILASGEKAVISNLAAIFKNDGRRIIPASNQKDIFNALSSPNVEAVYIHYSLIAEWDNLRDRIRCLAPGITVRRFNKASELILFDNDEGRKENLLLDNLDLFSALLASQSGAAESGGGRVGRYTNRICLKMNIRSEDRLPIVCAGYLHDLAQHYYRLEDVTASRQVIKQTVKLLSSLGYYDLIRDILNNMYKEPPENPDLMPLAVLGGNILTIIHLYCESAPVGVRLPLDKFDAISQKLAALSGKLFLPQVVEAFSLVIEEELLSLQAGGKALQVMIYSEEKEIQQPLQIRLRNEGFRTVSDSAAGSFIDLCHRSNPDVIVLYIPGEPEKSAELVEKLAQCEIDIEKIPTFLLARGSAIGRLSGLIEQGIEDIIPFDDNMELFITKMRKLRDRIIAREEERQRATQNESGAYGCLSDMNLIDLIQALGPGQKTARITITPNHSRDMQLTIHLEKGQIIRAELGDKIGPEAIYEGLTWTSGNWKIDPVKSEDLPATNISLPNESILMEGCRLLDEKSRT